MVTEFVHPDVGPLFAEEKTGLFAFPNKFFHEIMGPPGLQPTPIGRTGAGLAFKQNVQVTEGAREKRGVAKDGKGGRRFGQGGFDLENHEKAHATLIGNLLDPMESAWVISIGFS